jgi:hypothetical protein
MRGLTLWIAVAAAAFVAGCADGTSGLTSPTPLAVATPSVPSTCELPGAPGDLTADVIGSSVSLAWSEVGEASDYVVLIGWTPTTAETLLTNASTPHHAADDIPSGTHFARVHAHNWCGTSEPSDAITFTVN